MFPKLAPRLCSLGLLLVCGCADTGSARMSSTGGDKAAFASRRILDTSVEAVRPAAMRVFKQYFRVDTQASTGSDIISRPQEADARAEAEQVRDVIGISPSRRRNMAELRIRAEGSAVVVLCRVQSERLETVERTAFARERGDDRPTDTPINRMGGASPNRTEEWRAGGRDRKTELLILDGIEKALSTSQPASE